MNPRSWWWKGKPGLLQSMGSQRVGHDWANELNCLSQEPNDVSISVVTNSTLFQVFTASGLKFTVFFFFCFVYTGFLKFSSSLKLSIHWSQTIIISKYSTNHIHFFPQKTSLELFPVLNDIRATKRGWLSLSQFPDEIIRNPQKSPTSSPKWPKHSDIRFWKKAIQMQPGSKRPHSIHGWR